MSQQDLDNALRAAVKANDAAGVTRALAKGATPTIPLNPAGRRPLLTHAIERGHNALALILLGAGASVDFTDLEVGHAPWYEAIEKNNLPMFLAMWERHPFLGDPQFGVKEGAPASTRHSPWAHAALARNRPLLGALIDRAHANRQKLPPELACLLAQEVAQMDQPEGMLQALMDLSPDPALFIENVAWGASHAGTISGRRERDVRAARQWALEHDASFVCSKAKSWREPPSESTPEPAVSFLARFPYRAAGGLADWLARYADNPPAGGLDAALDASLAAGKAEPFQAVWSALKKQEPHRAGRPFLLQRALASAFRGSLQGAPAFLRSVLQAEPVPVPDAAGNTVIHEAIRQHARRSASADRADPVLLDRVLLAAVSMFREASVSLESANHEGITAIEYARSAGTNPAIVAGWEEEVLLATLPKPQPKTPRRFRL